MITPGYLFDTIGGKLSASVTVPSTNRLLIIGTAVDGPVNEPLQIQSAQELERVFGPAKYSNGYKDPNDLESGKYNGATLPLAFRLAQVAGCDDIWVVRATGTKASNTTAFSSYFDIESQFAGDIYNDVTITLATGTGAASGVATFTISQPEVKGGSFSISMATTTTVEEAIKLINDDRRNRTIYIDANTYPLVLTDTVGDMSDATVTLTGGTNQTDAPGEALFGNKALYATKLTATDTGTFDMLLGDRFQFAVAVLTGLYLDDEVVAADSSKSIFLNYASWLESMSKRARPCLGVIGCRPTGIRDTADFITYINDSLLATDPGYYDQDADWIKAGPFLYNGAFYTDGVNRTIDLGGRVCVTAGTDCIWSHPDTGRYIDSFHVPYAAMLTTIEPENSAQYKPITGALGYVNKLPGKYADLLSAGVGASVVSNTSGRGAYTVLVPNFRDPRGSRVVYEDATASFRNDYFRQAQLQNLVNSIHIDLYDRLIDYIGKPSSLSTQAAMKADVRAVLDGYVSSGGLKGGEGLGYQFNLKVSGTDEALGIVRLDLSVFPSTSIRAIVQTITVMRNAG